MKYTYDKEILEVLKRGDVLEIRKLFAITDNNIHDTELILKKQDLFLRVFFPKAYSDEDKDFHDDSTRDILALYRNEIDTLMQLWFRGGGKTTKPRFSLIFFIANDIRASRKRYIKIHTKGPENGIRFTTGLYNALNSAKMQKYYGHLFKKTGKKKLEEKMSSFLTSTGVLVRATSVGVEQRGNVQGDEENIRPDFLIYDDFEDSLTVQSLVTTKKLWANMEESYNGRDPKGVCLYNGNYISKRRNVQKLIDRAKKDPTRHRVRIVPIIRDFAVNEYGRVTGTPVWPERFPLASIQKTYDDLSVEGDFHGEFLCEPQGVIEGFFSEQQLNKHPIMKPILETGNWTYLLKRDPTHKYIIGIDPAGGTGGNFGVIMIIDFTLKMIAAYYRDRYISPDDLGELALDRAKVYNNALIVHETNYQGFTITSILKKANYHNVYVDELADEKVDRKQKEGEERTSDKLGFTTTSISKPMILNALSRAIRDFSFIVNDKTVRDELINFPREYVELVKPDDDEFGHFDLTMALAIAFEGRKQMYLGKVESTKY